MKVAGRMSSVAIILVLCFSFIGCDNSKRVEDKKNVALKNSVQDNIRLAAGKARTRFLSGKKDKLVSKKRSVLNQVPFFSFKFDQAKSRLLHYNVNLRFETKAFSAAREAILAVAAKYGYVKYSSSSVAGNLPYISTQIKVKVGHLYDALRDLNKVGKLTRETISTRDHTERMVWAERRMKRLALRALRNNNSLRRGSPLNRNWNSQEHTLQRTEDQQDRKAQQQWKIKDRIAWADINVYVQVPASEASIDKPDFKATFKWLLSGALYLLDALIYLIPLLLLVLVVLRQRKRILGWFGFKK